MFNFLSRCFSNDDAEALLGELMHEIAGVNNTRINYKRANLFVRIKLMIHATRSGHLFVAAFSLVFQICEIASSQVPNVAERQAEDQKTPDQKTPVQELGVGKSDLRAMESLVNDLAKQFIPHKYEKKKDWGMQAERWDGLHVQLKGLRLKTKRRKKMVNHGTWKMYSAELTDPKNGLQFSLNSIKKDAKGNAKIDLSVTADLKLFGRIAEWVKGVQLFSVSADATANITLNVKTTVGAKLDFSHLPPDFLLEPKVDSAKLIVNEFRVLRVSKAGGEIAQQVGRGARKILDGKIEEQEIKLVAKMNKSIAKKKDELRLSVKELIDSEWSKIAGDYVPLNEIDVDVPPKSKAASAKSVKPKPVRPEKEVKPTKIVVPAKQRN